MKENDITNEVFIGEKKFDLEAYNNIKNFSLKMNVLLGFSSAFHFEHHEK